MQSHFCYLAAPIEMPTLIIDRSKFIAAAIPIHAEEEAIEFIKSVKSAHYDATHNVYVYALGETRRRYSDDGEPAGTAGIPLLRAIESAGVTDCCLVVTRYFGGILLGRGGLTRAYGKAATDCLAAARLVRRIPCRVCRFTCAYSFYDRLTSLLPSQNAIINDTTFADDVSITFRLPVKNIAPLTDALAELTLGKGKLTDIGSGLVEKPVSKE